MKKILVPLDGSDFSTQILPAISSFFDPATTEIVLFEAIDPDSVLTDVERSVTATELTAVAIASRSAEYRKRSEEAAKRTYQHGQAIAHQHEKTLKERCAALEALGYTVTSHAEVGEAADEIVRYAKIRDVDLIAMATHGRTGLTRLLMGSVAEAIMRHASVPVLLLRPS